MLVAGGADGGWCVRSEAFWCAGWLVSLWLGFPLWCLGTDVSGHGPPGQDIARLWCLRLMGMSTDLWSVAPGCAWVLPQKDLNEMRGVT